ncbi:MAG: amidohydrolase [Acidobacteria bacterium]|nr:MAG: amidohydrolase [Acidobacteriota bacterium]
MRRISVLSLVCILLALGCAQPPQPADFIVLGGAIHTFDPMGMTVEALAARGQHILALGTEDEIRLLIGPDTEVLDLEGAVAYPGFIDAHAHFLGVGKAQMQLKLQGAATWQAIVDQVAMAVSETPKGEWIFGRGWHQEKWAEAPEGAVEGLPIHDALSAVSPDNPVMLTHASGHAAIVNARALEMAGIGPTTPDPPGGEIVRDSRGRAIGVLRETAEALVYDVIESEDSDELFRRKVALATEECLANGLTSFQDAGSSIRDAKRFKAMAEAGELQIRLSLMLHEPNDIIEPQLDAVRMIGAGDGFLTVRAIKRWIDGALGSHGAWLLEPYSDLPASAGLNTEPLDSMAETARLAMEHGYQFCTHAIGDRANRETLDIYQVEFEGHPESDNLRWRIEHAQHLSLDDIPRFAQMGVIASIQPTHCTSDGPWVPQRLGDARAESGAYVWRDLLESGAVLAAGTDAPVEAVDPLATFRSAVTREMADGNAFYPDQSLTREEALRAMTLGAAYAVFEEDQKGSLRVGKYADLTVLSDDLLVFPEADLDDVTVVATIVGGELRYSGR